MASLRGIERFSQEWVLWESSHCGGVRKEIPAIGSHYQRTGEDTAELEDFVLAIVNCRLCRFMDC
jgi:hypothetical protein